MQEPFHREISLVETLREMKSGNLVLDERDSSLDFAHALSVLAISENSSSELTILWLDGANSFNPYRISELSRKMCLDSERVLRKIRISRAFTCYQMMSLILDRVEESLEIFGPLFVVITGLPRIFSSSDLPEQEALRAFEPVVENLRRFQSTGLAMYLTASKIDEESEFVLHLESISDLIIKPQERGGDSSNESESLNPSMKRNSSQTATKTLTLGDFA